MGSAIMSPTVMRGFSDEYGSWKMICIRRRVLRSSEPLQLAEVDALEPHAALDLRAGAVEQAEDGPARGRLAAARLADEAERLSAPDLEGDAVHRLAPSPRRG